MAVVGAVLCGGASRRMGRDKALIEVDGVALAARVAAALRAGGCGPVLAVGGDAPALAALGLDPVPDRWPGEGPLGGVVTALAVAVPGDVVVVAPCDWVHPTAAVVGALVGALAGSGTPGGGDDGAAVAHPRTGGRAQWLPSAWRVGGAAAARADELFRAGERRLAPAIEAAAPVVVDLAPAAVADADTPEDLP